MGKGLPALRVEITLDHCADGAEQRRTVEELRGFFAEASRRMHRKCEVVQVDPAQIFHEKTHVLNPRNLPEDETRWPKSLRQLKRQMDKGRYEVLPAGPIEQRYYDALRPLAFTVLQAEEPDYLNTQDVHQPEDLHAGHLQHAWKRHIASLRKDSPHRDSEAFRHYAQTRADCGEEAMAHYLSQRNPQERAEKMVNLFVSLDRGALERVTQAPQQEQSCVAAVHPRQFAEMAGQLAQAVRDAFPECADIPLGKTTRHADGVEASRFGALLAR